MFFTEFADFSDKNICHYSKKAWTCHPATSCVRDQDATPVSAWHMWDTGSLNWAQFMLQWLIRFPEFTEFCDFLFHLGKNPLSSLRVINLWTEHYDDGVQCHLVLKIAFMRHLLQDKCVTWMTYCLGASLKIHIKLLSAVSFHTKM